MSTEVNPERNQRSPDPAHGGCRVTQEFVADRPIEDELEWLRYHLNGIEYAIKGQAAGECVPDPYDIVSLVQSAQDRVTGLIQAAEAERLKRRAELGLDVGAEAEGGA